VRVAPGLLLALLVAAVATRAARASLVNSSITLRNRTCRPSAVTSL
jgi:hypothetical protein